MSILDFIRHPWPWWVSGIAIAAIMVVLILFGKKFGVSTNLETMCTILGAGRSVDYFRVDWKKSAWNLLFLAGAVTGGWISAHWLSSPEPLRLSAATIRDLQVLNIHFDGQTAPSQVFNMGFALSAKGLFILVGGGMLIGFGTRYASGCTSGHAISGLSNLQLPSLIAVIGFFIGGLAATHLLYPLIFRT
jgi:uncharacterized membrane protein YedE/YeeE